MTTMTMGSTGGHSHKEKKVNRPTEEKALASIVKEALKRGISQVQLLNMFATQNKKDGICHCAYCRRTRARLGENA